MKEHLHTLTKAKMVAKLSKDMGLEKAFARTLVQHFFELITTTLINGQPVKLTHFGQFSIQYKSGRPGRNPKTREDVWIPARCVVTFKSSDRIRSLL